MKFYTTKQVRACNLQELERLLHKDGEHLVIRIDGVWREPFDVYAEPDDATVVYGEGHVPSKILERLDTSTPLWVVVRYLVEEKSTSGGEIEDELAFLRYRDLIEVQMPEENA
jgi:hypothetical protein